MEPTGVALLRTKWGLMTKIAEGLGITRAAVNMWEKIPAERVPEVSRITGFSRHQLRPDLWEPTERDEEAAD